MLFEIIVIIIMIAAYIVISCAVIYELSYGSRGLSSIVGVLLVANFIWGMIAIDDYITNGPKEEVYATKYTYTDTNTSWLNDHDSSWASETQKTARFQAGMTTLIVVLVILIGAFFILFLLTSLLSNNDRLFDIVEEQSKAIASKDEIRADGAYLSNDQWHLYKDNKMLGVVENKQLRAK